MATLGPSPIQVCPIPINIATKLVASRPDWAELGPIWVEPAPRLVEHKANAVEPKGPGPTYGSRHPPRSHAEGAPNEPRPSLAPRTTGVQSVLRRPSEALSKESAASRCYRSPSLMNGVQPSEHCFTETTYRRAPLWSHWTKTLNAARPPTSLMGARRASRAFRYVLSGTRVTSRAAICTSCVSPPRAPKP